MYLLRIECHSFEPSHQNHDARSLEPRSMRFKGVDSSFSRLPQCHTEEEVACIERALASFQQLSLQTTGSVKRQGLLRIGSKNSKKPVRMSIPTGVL